MDTQFLKNAAAGGSIPEDQTKTSLAMLLSVSACGATLGWAIYAV